MFFFKNVTSNVYFPLMFLPSLDLKINFNTQCKKKKTTSGRTRVNSWKRKVMRGVDNV